jgi:hypothetical protein
VPFEEVEERVVGIFPGLREHAVEVADRLMVVDHEDEPDSRGHAEPRRREWGPNRWREALAVALATVFASGRGIGIESADRRFAGAMRQAPCQRA